MVRQAMKAGGIKLSAGEDMSSYTDSVASPCSQLEHKMGYEAGNAMICSGSHLSSRVGCSQGRRPSASRATYSTLMVRPPMLVRCVPFSARSASSTVSYCARE